MSRNGVLRIGALLALSIVGAGCAGAQSGNRDARGPSGRDSGGMAAERGRSLEQYRDCMRDARGDVLGERICQPYLDAAEPD